MRIIPTGDVPVIHSLLDQDFYKFTMGQVVYHKHRDVPVVYRFILRTKGVRLADVIPLAQLREELAAVCKLRLSARELHYLRGVNLEKTWMFKPDYIEFLTTLALDPVDVVVKDGNFDITVSGRWSETIYWETIILQIISELYYRNLMKKEHFSAFDREAVIATGQIRLMEKIKRLRTRPHLSFSDFGTRRRFSFDWQRYVVETLSNELDGMFRGTSCVLIAMETGLQPIGTNAHEYPMALEALRRGESNHVVVAQHQVLSEWWEEYGEPLSVILPDTFGTDFCLNNLTAEHARNWRGIRQDSGDPVVMGDKYLAFYRRHGVDPLTKLMIPSDGLTDAEIFRIDDALGGKIRVSSGWGTHLMNDLGLPNLSMVVKLSQAGGRGTVKLSDNLAKATGKPEDIEAVKRAVGYSTAFNRECQV